MNVIFQDTLRPSLNSSSHAQSSTSAQPFCSSRQFIDQLKRFIQANDPPSSTHSSSGLSLSDAGFILLRLKDQLLSPDQRSAYFPAEFVSRPYNGIDVLVKVIVVLQNIVNSVGSSSKISSLLTRTNSSTNRRRKAAVAEADCIECVKILLEKTPAAWRSLLETPTNLDVILYSVHSPQLDSKCYALEIIILLLDQPHGFVILFRSLSYIAARNRDYLRLNIFISQLKHGLHTSKLHIQILVVRLLNKLLQQAPSATHRIMAQTDAVLSNFSPEYLEKLVIDATAPLGGTENLMEEIAVWKSLYTPIVARRDGLPAMSQNPAYSYTYSEADSDTTRSERDRRRLGMKFSGQTSVTKNIERQRLKRHGDGYGSNGHLPSRLLTSNGNANSYYPSQTLTKSWDTHNGYPQTRADREDRFERPEFGGMRRAKSESAMAIEEDTLSRSLKQNDDFPERRRGELTSKLSRSIHDLSRDHTLTEVRPGSATMTRSLRRTTSPPRAHFAEPLVDNKPAIQGFSYLFPTQPVISNVPAKQRARTPDPYKNTEAESVSFNVPPIQRPPSAPVFDSPHSPDYSSNAYPVPAKTNGQVEKVVYIPISTPNDGHIRTLPRTNNDGSTSLRRYDYRRQTDGMMDDYSMGSRSSSTSRLRSPGSYTGTIGDDVKDALSQFDYLNDYDAASIRGMPNTKCAPTTYHF